MKPVEALTVSNAALRAGGACPDLTQALGDGVVLGVDPATCRPWEEGETSATLDLYVPFDYAGSVLTLRISWPDAPERGLRAVEPGLTATIAFDGQVTWRKRAAAARETDGLVYAARDLAQTVTFVPRQAGAHQVVMTLPAGMTWTIGSVEVGASLMPENIMGIAYSPYRDCQTGDPASPQPSDEEINADLAQILHSGNAVRTYAATGASGKIPWLAGQMGIPVYAGVWLDAIAGDTKSESADQVEMEAINHIVGTSTVQAVIVGNEYYLRHEKEAGAADYPLSRIRQFKQANPQVPVATAETDDKVFDWSDESAPVIRDYYRPILDAVDMLFVHIYPFWQNRPVEGAAAITLQRYQAVQKLLDETYGGKKRLVLGEAGWPSSGTPDQNYAYRQAAYVDQVAAFLASPAAQRRYLIELEQLAAENGVNLFYFDGFDELWKREGFGGAGRSGGCGYSDRSAKYDLSSLLVPPGLLPAPDTEDVFPATAAAYYDPKTWLFPVYSEWPADPFMPPQQAAGFKPFEPALMGDMESLKVNSCRAGAHSGDTALELTYVSGGGKGWAGLTWLYPPGNWGKVEQGVPLGQALALSFWARGKHGGEVAEFFAGGVCGEYDGVTPPLCPDSIQPKLTTGNVVLDKEWKQYVLNLDYAAPINVVGGFGVAISQVYNPAGAVIDVDEVVYLSELPASEQAEVFPQAYGDTFSVYTDYTALDNHYIPSNFMGDGAAGFLKMDQNWREQPHSGDTSIRVDYTAGPEGWAGVFWTEPENNWGQRPGGYPLMSAERLTFWARSEVEGLPVKVLVGGIGCNQPHSDSLCPGITQQIYLSTNWQVFSIELQPHQRELWALLGGFGLTTNRPGSIYLDDIVYWMGE